METIEKLDRYVSKILTSYPPLTHEETLPLFKEFMVEIKEAEEVNLDVGRYKWMVDYILYLKGCIEFTSKREYNEKKQTLREFIELIDAAREMGYGVGRYDFLVKLYSGLMGDEICLDTAKR